MEHKIMSRRWNIFIWIFAICYFSFALVSSVFWYNATRLILYYWVNPYLPATYYQYHLSPLEHATVEAASRKAEVVAKRDPVEDSRAAAARGDFRLLVNVYPPGWFMKMDEPPDGAYEHRLLGVQCDPWPGRMTIPVSFFADDLWQPFSQRDGKSERYARVYNRALIQSERFPYKDVCSLADRYSGPVKTWTEAVRSGEMAAITSLSLHNIDINQADPLDRTAMDWASARCDRKMIVALLDKGADPSVAGPTGDVPPLFVALSFNDLKLAQRLRRLGAVEPRASYYSSACQKTDGATNRQKTYAGLLAAVGDQTRLRGLLSAELAHDPIVSDWRVAAMGSEMEISRNRSDEDAAAALSSISTDFRVRYEDKKREQIEASDKRYARVSSEATDYIRVAQRVTLIDDLCVGFWRYSYMARVFRLCKPLSPDATVPWQVGPPAPVKPAREVTPPPEVRARFQAAIRRAMAQPGAPAMATIVSTAIEANSVMAMTEILDMGYRPKIDDPKTVYWYSGVRPYWSCDPAMVELLTTRAPAYWDLKSAPEQIPEILSEILTMCGDPEIISMIVKSEGIDINILDDNALTVLDYAKVYRPEWVATIRAAGGIAMTEKLTPEQQLLIPSL